MLCDNALHGLNGRHFVFRGASSIRGFTHIVPSGLQAGAIQLALVEIRAQLTSIACPRRPSCPPSCCEAKAKLLLIWLDAERSANALRCQHASGSLDQLVKVVFRQIESFVLDGANPALPLHAACESLVVSCPSVERATASYLEQSEAPLTRSAELSAEALILSPLPPPQLRRAGRAGRGEPKRTCLGSLFGDSDRVPPKAPSPVVKGRGSPSNLLTSLQSTPGNFPLHRGAGQFRGASPRC
jgi:hypothetical protein